MCIYIFIINVQNIIKKQNKNCINVLVINVKINSRMEKYGYVIKQLLLLNEFNKCRKNWIDNTLNHCVHLSEIIYFKL